MSEENFGANGSVTHLAQHYQYLYTPIQNVIGPNISEEQNYVTCEQRITSN